MTVSGIFEKLTHNPVQEWLDCVSWTFLINNAKDKDLQVTTLGEVRYIFVGCIVGSRGRIPVNAGFHSLLRSSA